jgi:periplasmic protein TonB
MSPRVSRRIQSTMAQEAFGSFTHYGESAEQSSWASSLAASSAIYVVIGLLALSIPVTKHIVDQRKPVELKFVERVVKPPAPLDVPVPKIDEHKPIAAPRAVPQQKPAAAAAAPIVRPDQKIRRLDKPPPPKQLTVPKEMPEEAAKEIDKELDKGIAVWGDGGKGDVAGLEGGMAGGVAGGMVGGGAISVPEDAEPPVPSSHNTKPAFPSQALASKQTGTVVLKVIILADGSVSDVEVMRGEEPFTSAAVEAVKRWKYQPARWKGQAITVYRIIQIPFKLTG